MASRIVRSECCSDSANSSGDDMGHQKYTDVIHPRNPNVRRRSGESGPDDINGYRRTSEDTRRTFCCDQLHTRRAVLQSRTRSKQSLSATTGLPILQRRRILEMSPASAGESGPGCLPDGRGAGFCAVRAEVR